jgi:hypothetical protein
MLHLTVNLENEKAISLYKNLGYQHASDRAPVTKFLTGEERVSENLLVVQIAPEAAAALATMNYGKMDMSPAPSTRDGFLKLVSSSQYEGTFVAVDRSELSPMIVQLEQDGDDEALSSAVEQAIRSGERKSYGGISLQNGSAVKQFKVIRLVFLKETWLSLPFQITLLCVLLALLSFWWCKLLCRMTAAAAWQGLINMGTAEERRVDNSTWGFWSLSLLLVETFAVAITSMGAYKLVNFVRFIVTRDSSHLSGRAFAPFSHGPMGIDCLRGALVASQNNARKRGYGIWILNVAEKHPDSAAFSKRGFRTKFLQKWLCDSPSKIDGEKEGSEEWKEFSFGAFCDPRDL